MFKGSVQPRNKAHARSATTSSFAVRTRKPLQEVKMSCFCSLPTISTFETEKVESLTAKTRKQVKNLTTTSRNGTHESHSKLAFMINVTSKSENETFLIT